MIFGILGLGTVIGLVCAMAISNMIDAQERRNEERKHRH